MSKAGPLPAFSDWNGACGQKRIAVSLGATRESGFCPRNALAAFLSSMCCGWDLVGNARSFRSSLDRAISYLRSNEYPKCIAKKTSWHISHTQARKSEETLSKLLYPVRICKGDILRRERALVTNSRTRIRIGESRSGYQRDRHNKRHAFKHLSISNSVACSVAKRMGACVYHIPGSSRKTISRKNAVTSNGFRF